MVIWFAALSLLTMSSVIVALIFGGRPDPLGPAMTLSGAWRFHPGDEAHWADPQFDDNAWDRINLISLPQNRDNDVGLPGWLAGWKSYGHPNLVGYAWYRRKVVLPVAGKFVLLGPTMVDDGYRMFWNGRPIGGFGKVDSSAKLTGVRPFIAEIPRAAGEGDGVLAIKTFMQPGLLRDNLSGGLRSVPTLATTTFGDALYRAQWFRTIAGYIVEVALPFMLTVLACVVLAVASSIGRPRFVHWLAAALVATALLRLGNAISAWTDLIDANLINGLNSFVWSPLAMLSWTATWNEWADGRDRRVILAAALGASAIRILGAALDADTLVTCARLVFIVLFTSIAVRVAARGERRPLALSTMLTVALALFANELRRVGLPYIWFPFNIGVTLPQFAYAMTVILLPFLLPQRASSCPDEIDIIVSNEPDSRHALGLQTFPKAAIRSSGRRSAKIGRTGGLAALHAEKMKRALGRSLLPATH